MNNNVNRDFYVYENGELVAEAETIIMSVSETKKEFKLENIDIYPNFHLLNDENNFYEIKFQSESGEVKVTYCISDCVIKNRSEVSEDYKNIEFIEGTFQSISGNLNELLKSNV